MTERQLLDRFITANDPDAFRVLIERHGPMVLSVCRTVLREPHDVEDAFQNTFLILASRAATIKTATPSGHGSIGWRSGWPRRHGSRSPNVGPASGIAPDFEPEYPYRPARLFPGPVAPRRGESLAGSLPAARRALLPGGKIQPGGRNAVEVPGRDDQRAAFEGSANTARSLEPPWHGLRPGAAGRNLSRMTGGRTRPKPPPVKHTFLSQLDSFRVLD